MVYFTNIPQPTDRPSDSQSQLLQNFQTLDTVFTVDHLAFSAGLTPGYHKQVTFDDNHVPGAAPTGTKSILYTKDVDGEPALFWQNEIAEMPISPNAGGTYAWCTFSGGPLPTIINGFNVGLVTRLANPGQYTITYTTPLTVGIAGATFIFGQIGGQYVVGRLVAGDETFTTVEFARVSASTLAPQYVDFGNFQILGS
jgi:hypothetical protein